MEKETQPYPCNICAHPATQKCAGCKKVYYCSREHQQMGWRRHKALCKIYKTEPPLDSNTYCGLCGKQGPLKQTDCCNRTICDMSEDPFTHPENVLDICPRNHRLYTLCGIHHDNHPQTCDWRDCQKCKDNIIPFERFVGYGTSRYNFDGTWKDPPTFPPTNCEKCGKLLFVNLGNVIYKADGGCICAEHQQLPPSLAKSLLSSGKFKVESFGMS